MTIRTWKVGALLAGLVGLICQVDAGAQTTTLPYNLTFSNNTNVTFGIDANGVLSETGPLNYNATTYTFSGSNPQLLWLPAFGAFRAGAFSGTQTIGQYSVVFGLGTATAPYSFAMGPSTASGNISFARGVNCTASGPVSTAMGVGATAIGPSSTVLGGGTANGSNSTVLGGGTAIGNYSNVLGSGFAVGAYSTATGYAPTSDSYSSFSIGQFNVGLAENGGIPSLSSWVSTDPVFEIGNGSSSVKSDALVVYKDGSAQFSGPVKVPQSGDIPMYTGN